MAGKRFEIIYDRDGCIGAASCASISDNWEIAEDGKANFKVKEFGEDMLETEMKAAKSCPVHVIHIRDKQTGKQLI
jgi:ferredoxin